MNLAEFQQSLNQPAPPAGLAQPLVALWHDGRGDWQRAHQTVQSDDTPGAARVHAYLHRKEGDLANAHHWYGRAGDTLPRVTLDEEWRNLVRAGLELSAAGGR